MILFGDRVVCSTDDLVVAARCEFALLRALDTELGLVFSPDASAGDLTSSSGTPTAETTGSPGLRLGSDAVPAEAFEDLIATFGDGLVRIDPPAASTPAEWTRAHDATMAALRAGAPVVAGAIGFDGEFVAGCAFVVRAEHTLRMYAHASGSEVTALMEAAACARMLRDNGFDVDPWVRVRDSTGAEDVHELAYADTVHSARRVRLRAILTAKQDELLPVQWGDRRYLACGDCASCTAELVAVRDLLLVAGMRPAVRAQLRDAGITTVDRLASADSAVTGIPVPTLSLLRRQAELRLRRERTGDAAYVVTDATVFGELAGVDAGDVFISVAGSAVGVGVTARSADGGEGVFLFHAFTTHDPVALLEFLADRQQHHPELRIYHYRSPIRTLLADLCARCGADEDTAEDLLGALLDLYPIVRSAILIGARSYDLLEVAELLDPDAAGGGTDLESSCAATLRVRDRLSALAAEHDIRPQPVPRGAGAEQPSAVEAALREFAFDYEETRSPAQQAAALMAAVLGHPRRERLPLHWAHEDRLHRPIGEWADTAGVLVADWAEVDTKWQHTDNRPMRRYLTLTGRLGTGRPPPPGTPVRTLYDGHVPDLPATPGRRVTAAATVLGCALDDNFDDVVRVEEVLPPGCAPYDELPIAIVPDPPWPDENQERALGSVAHELLVSLPEVPHTATFDVLCRRRPRLLTTDALPEVFGDYAAAVTAALLDLDDSYLAVQGPSGTGKTDTVARVVERLVTRYRWRVGVVAQSHSAAEELLDAVVRVGVLPELVAKSDVHTVAPEWLGIAADRYPRFLDNAVNGCVIGGLPGDFTDPEQVAPASLDLLVIADAGHFPLAQAIAVGPATRNLLLLGDPAPLPGNGLHPERVHDSALGRIVGDNPTLPSDFGYFLERTWRMHPQLCGPVSRLRYGNRLRSNETVTLARELEDVPPGVSTVPVEHHGNSTESAEEAREIVRQVRGLLGRTWRQGAPARRLHPHDILVVTPYHAQVARIRTLLSRARIEDVVVGTADRFRGREATVVLISMTTSAPGDAPDGMDELLSRHWLTTAVSRAMWSAVVVASPLLTDYLPETPGQLPDLAAFLELTGG
ncbi:AAA domain-containing protein [Nocardia sp. NPDC052254]|uniref:bifunctional RecB family nuclease/DEAD/DEAH box helicase n=1 Tax=Nocardia sp. NPDC052254 TaxID=3155681 RepID=UPI003433954B